MDHAEAEASERRRQNNAVALDEILSSIDFYRTVHPKIMAFPNFLETGDIPAALELFASLMHGCIAGDFTSPYPTRVVHIGSVSWSGHHLAIAFIPEDLEDTAWSMYAYLMERFGEVQEPAPRPANRGAPAVRVFLSTYQAFKESVVRAGLGKNAPEIHILPDMDSWVHRICFLFEAGTDAHALESWLGPGCTLSAPPIGGPRLTFYAHDTRPPEYNEIPSVMQDMMSALIQLPALYIPKNDTRTLDSVAHVGRVFRTFRHVHAGSTHAV